MSSILHTKKAGIEFNYFINKVVDVYRGLEPMIWTTRHEDEIGFYEKSKKLQTELFFGIWYEVWEKYETPICYNIVVNSNARSEKYDLIRKYISESKYKGLKYLDYNDFAVVLVEEGFYNAEDDEERLSSIFQAISRRLGF